MEKDVSVMLRMKGLSRGITIPTPIMALVLAARLIANRREPIHALALLATLEASLLRRKAATKASVLLCDAQHQAKGRVLEGYVAVSMVMTAKYSGISI